MTDHRTAYLARLRLTTKDDLRAGYQSSANATVPPEESPTPHAVRGAALPASCLSQVPALC